MNFGMIGAGLVMGIAAIGSAIGIGIAGQGAIGAWKRCFMANKPAPFILTVFVGAPLTQTIYGFLLMNFINSALQNGLNGTLALFIGIFGGAVIGLSAFFQGRCAAAACDALGETGKGTSNYLIVIGIIETVALFTLVFCLLLLNSVA